MQFWKCKLLKAMFMLNYAPTDSPKHACLCRGYNEYVFENMKKVFSNLGFSTLAKSLLLHIVKKSVQFSVSRQKGIHCSPVCILKLFKDCLTSNHFGKQPLTHTSQFAEDSSLCCLLNLIKEQPSGPVFKKQKHSSIAC